MSMLIVLVEDIPDVADSTAALLRTFGGHTVEIASDGPSALSLARALKPDAMVIDIGLPGMTGYEVAREVRREEWAVGILLIALSGYGKAEDIERAIDAGFNAHRTKPVESNDLLGMLDEWETRLH
jgi:CheY-like chemotaxis protein